MYYIYMIRCEDNSVYTGITVDLKRRMEEHFSRSRNCAKYTLAHPAEKLEAVWQSENRVLAAKLEYHIKKLSKKQKERLICENDFGALKGKVDKENYKRVKCEMDFAL